MRNCGLLSVILLPACLVQGVWDDSGAEGDDPGAPLPGDAVSVPTRHLDLGDPDDTGEDPGNGDSGGEDSAVEDSGGGDSGVDSGSDSGGGDGPLDGISLYVDPASNAAQEADDIRAGSPEDAALMDKIADQPVAKWLGSWSGDVAATVDAAVTEAGSDIRTFVAYDIPNRDCGGYSSGGSQDADAYTAWVDDIATGLAGRPAIVVLEPDSLALVTCLDDADYADRVAMLNYAVDTLTDAGAWVYMDAGHSAWNSVEDISARLDESGVSRAAGFYLNVSNFRTTDESVAFGQDVSALLGGARFIVDTSRNGLGPDGTEWCNPSGRALGEPPEVAPGIENVDALLWVKTPGESDGSCNGGPSAGSWWPEYALGLAERAAW